MIEREVRELEIEEDRDYYLIGYWILVTGFDLMDVNYVNYSSKHTGFSVPRIK